MQDVLNIPSVTGVDLNLRIAGPGARSFAFIIDWHIRLLAAIAWFAAGVWLMLGSFDPTAVAVGTNFQFTVVLPALAIYFLYHPLVELIMGGRSPGKRIAGVRVIRTDGAIPGAGTILIRNVFRLLDCLPVGYCVGLAVAILSERSQRVGDFAAGTVLVYDESTTDALADFSGDTLGRFRIEEVELVHELLGRWKSLDPETRHSLARQLLRQLNARPHDPLQADLQTDLRTDGDLRHALESVLTDTESRGQE